MKHTSRCEDAKPDSKCVCQCGGAQHGVNNMKKDDDSENRSVRSINENLGGEVARTIKILTGVNFVCTCGKKQILYDFQGYPHAGGLEDADKNRWWVLYECVKCHYQWSWSKIVHHITLQKRLKI